jgi:sn-glycerol 3-phosphate transport system permease protein
MVENRPVLAILRHVVLILGALVVLFPVWVAFVASTHPNAVLISQVTPLWPGDRLLENYGTILFDGVSAAGSAPVGLMLLNSTVMALAIALGKVAISLVSAFAIVYFRFPFRMLAFWIIFMTIMLPVEVRILPTFEVIADLGMLTSYAGLSVPLIASATAHFLFRQFFLTVPDELAEAARMDGAGPARFFVDILVPLSRTNIAAIFVIMFLFGWNQYLWPLLVTTDEGYTTIVMGIYRMLQVADAVPQWHLVMATAVLALLPPVLVVLAMQRLFVKGLVETEK